MDIPQFLPTRCCGTCKHAVWFANGEGECHGGWWDYRDNRQPGRPWVQARPFLLSKGCGPECNAHQERTL